MKKPPPIERYQQLAQDVLRDAAVILAKDPDSDAGLEAEAFLLDDSSPFHGVLDVDWETMRRECVDPILAGKPVAKKAHGSGVLKRVTQAQLLDAARRSKTVKGAAALLGIGEGTLPAILKREGYTFRQMREMARAEAA